MSKHTTTEHRVFHSMGIPVHITLVNVPSAHTDEISERAFAIFDTHDKRFSRFKEDSELMKLNNAGGAWYRVTLPLFEMLKKSVALAAETNGIFDPSVGGILASYGYGLPKNFTPKDPLPTYRDIAFDDRELLVRLAPGQILEPAGLVKGVAIDDAAREMSELLDLSTQGFMINAGGDIVTRGAFEKESPWRIGIQAPNDPEAIIAMISLRDAGIATSGTYQTKGEYEGKEWHHLVQMNNSARTEITSATVIAPTCELADTEASLAILLPLTQALERLNQKGFPHLLLKEDGQMLKSASFQALEVSLKED